MIYYFLIIIIIVKSSRAFSLRAATQNRNPVIKADISNLFLQAEGIQGADISEVSGFLENILIRARMILPCYKPIPQK